MDDGTEITTAEAAEMLGVTARHVGWYHAKGLLVGRRIGARLLVFRREDVEAFVKPKKSGRPPKSTVDAKKTQRPPGRPKKSTEPNPVPPEKPKAKKKQPK